MKNNIPRIFAGCSLLCTLLFSFEVAAETYSCISGAAERKVEVVYVTEGYSVPCEVTYTKNAEMETLWRAENESGYCESKAQGLVDKLAAVFRFLI